mgnify:CR=1 FL=1
MYTYIQFGNIPSTVLQFKDEKCVHIFNWKYIPSTVLQFKDEKCIHIFNLEIKVKHGPEILPDVTKWSLKLKNYLGAMTPDPPPPHKH